MWTAGSAAAGAGGMLLRPLGQHAITLAETDFEGQRVLGCLQMLNEAIHVQAGMSVNTSFGLAKTFSIKVEGTMRSETSR